MRYRTVICTEPDDKFATDDICEYVIKNQLNYGWHLVKMEKCPKDSVNYITCQDMRYIVIVESNSENPPKFPPYGSKTFEQLRKN